MKVTDLSQLKYQSYEQRYDADEILYPSSFL